VAEESFDLIENFEEISSSILQHPLPFSSPTMLALRSLSRLAQRTTPRIASQTSRQLSIAARRPVLSSTAWTKPLSFRPIAAFSSTSYRPQGRQSLRPNADVHSISTPTDLTADPALDELVAKLDSEIQVERDISRPSSSSPSPSIQDFLENSGFQLQDTPGVEDVLLTKKYGDETIEVKFTIADLASPDVEGSSREELDEFSDEDYDGVESAQSGGANTKGAVNTGRTSGGNVRVAPEDSVSPADRETELEEDEEPEEHTSPAFPARVTVKVTRENQPGALTLECVAQDGDIIIDNVYYFGEAETADPANAEQEFKRRNAYAGPPFGNLDEGLQIGLERYLEERGINTYLAVFVPDYIDWKEQREYVRWLESKSNFL
jgi:complement component 1 Q subcomponent-binding protein